MHQHDWRYRRDGGFGVHADCVGVKLVPGSPRQKDPEHCWDRQYGEHRVKIQENLALFEYCTIIYMTMETAIAACLMGEGNDRGL